MRSCFAFSPETDESHFVRSQNLIWEQYPYPVALKTLLEGNSSAVIFNVTPVTELKPPRPLATGQVQVGGSRFDVRGCCSLSVVRCPWSDLWSLVSVAVASGIASLLAWSNHGRIDL